MPKQHNPRSPSNPNPDPNPKGQLLAVGSTMTGAVLGLGAVGYFLDYKFGWKPYGLLIGALLGVAVGMWDLYKTMFMERNK